LLNLDRTSIGRVLRKEREKKGWSLSNLANMTDHLSSSSMSNMERGFSGVSEKKIVEYCKLLDIDPNNLPKMVNIDNDVEAGWAKTLLRIEQKIDLLGSEQAHRELRKVEVEDKHPLYVVYLYLEARCYYHKGNFKKAEDRFTRALQGVKKHPDLRYSNISAACYKELGRIAFYYHHNLEQALSYTDQGLEAFNADGERKIIKYALLSGKASYLGKLQQNGESMKILEELWSEQNQWYLSNEIVLNIMEIRANLVAKNGFYDEALQYALEGMQLATAHENHERALEMATSLGKIYTLKKEYSEAEEWLKFALQLKTEVKRAYLFAVDTYTQLGILYMTLEQMDKALKHLKEAVSLGEKSKDGVQYYYAIIALADYYMKLNQFNQAIPLYEKAIDQAKKQTLSIIDPDIYAKMSRCYQTSDPIKSQKYMDKYLKIKLH
jgi:tetratricopeptide (TPR) repeat protein